MELLGAYRASLRGLGQAIQDVQFAGQGGGDSRERLATLLAEWFAEWFRHPDWRLLWAFMTAAQPSAKVVLECQREEREVLRSLPAAFGDTVQVIVYGGGIAAALDDGHAAGETLRRLLAEVWQQQERVPGVAAARSPCSAAGDPYTTRGLACLAAE